MIFYIENPPILTFIYVSKIFANILLTRPDYEDTYSIKIYGINYKFFTTSANFSFKYSNFLLMNSNSPFTRESSS